MTYLNLVSFHLSGQGVVGMTNEQEIGDVTVALPRPYLPIGGAPGVAPALEPTANGVLVGFDRWTGMCVLPGWGGVLPPSIGRHEQAVQAREFDRDLAIDRTSPAAEVKAWCVRRAGQQRAGGRS
ncbi:MULTISPECIES: hypothetical protein [unclassified Amycolatopsis]|uniref:hypothetical protein n=1 Tax=unclassified Amycolatopsis TaxID=2618356 RepID=UPI001C69C09E|nr:hypothetical protein [Amycolatopsis sp. DSM 110486]QYN19863.1 hypothetical protein K1T34_46035 [Amycolatopsis sp. DSM 110486]